jgi:hypothetical protein
MYVRGRLTSLSFEQLRAIARRVATELGDDELVAQLGGRAPCGVDGELKNIIFGSVGPKPRIVMRDAINNVIDVVENAESCLIYDRPLAGSGVTWGELADWWAARGGGTGRDLYQRLSQSLASPPERLLFRTYCERYGGPDGDEAPALLPQVYLHCDPYTRAERQRHVGEIVRERMDFLLLMPNQARIVLEVDGKHHYADDTGRASPARNVEMMAEDRKIRLKGYEVYRFGGAEFGRPAAADQLKEFFGELLAVHLG